MAVEAYAEQMATGGDEHEVDFLLQQKWLQEFEKEARLFGYENRKDHRARRHLEAREAAEAEQKSWEDYHAYLDQLFLQKNDEAKAAGRTPLALVLRLMRFLMGSVTLDMDGRSDYEKKVDEMGMPETPAEWEADPLKAQACRASDDQEGGAAGASELQIQILAEMNAGLKKPDPWFEDTSPHYQTRQDCIEMLKEPRFQNFFTFLIICNSITLGLNANDAIDVTVSTIIESVFTLLYTYELYVRYYGGDKYPWKSFAIWLDTALWIIAAVDLWLLSILNILLGIPKPNMSMVMVLRLFRLTKIIKAAEKFAFIARPLRLIQIVARFMGSVLGSVVLIYCTTFYCFSMMTISLLKNAGAKDIEGFTSITSCWYSYVTIVQGVGSYASDSLPALQDYTGARFAYRFGIGVLEFIGLFVLAIMVEQIDAAAGEDDTKQVFKQIRDEMNLDLIEKLLVRIDLKHDGMIDMDELGHAYFRHPFVADVLDKTLDQATQLLLELDNTKSGRVSISNYLIGLFKSKCGKKDVNTMMFEHTLKVCEDRSGDTYQTAMVYANEIKVRATKDGNDGISTLEGLVDEVDKMYGGMIDNEVTQAFNLHNFTYAIKELDEQLDHLNKMVAQTDFKNVKEASEGTQRIAGMRFAGDLKKFGVAASMWTEDSALVEEHMKRLVGHYEAPSKMLSYRESHELHSTEVHHHHQVKSALASISEH